MANRYDFKKHNPSTSRGNSSSRSNSNSSRAFPKDQGIKRLPKGAREMNTDRFLTRVFDKQEKKMVYLGDKFIDGTKFIGIIAKGILVTFDGILFVKKECGDRFIPMQCMGRRNKDDKLFYQHDIVKTHDNCLCTIEIDESMSAFVFQLVGDEKCKFCCTTLTIKRAEIIGNKWEHPALLEEK